MFLLAKSVETMVPTLPHVWYSLQESMRGVRLTEDGWRGYARENTSALHQSFFMAVLLLLHGITVSPQLVFLCPKKNPMMKKILIWEKWLFFCLIINEIILKASYSTTTIFSAHFPIDFSGRLTRWPFFILFLFIFCYYT